MVGLVPSTHPTHVDLTLDAENFLRGRPILVPTAMTQTSAETIAQFDRYVVGELSPIPGLPGPGRRLVGLGRRRAAAPRLLPGLGLQPARALPAPGGRGGSRPGRPTDPRAEHLVHRGPGGVRPGALGAVVRRPVLLLQQRGGGQRGGHQDGQGVRPCTRAGTRS